MNVVSNTIKWVVPPPVFRAISSDEDEAERDRCGTMHHECWKQKEVDDVRRREEERREEQQRNRFERKKAAVREAWFAVHGPEQVPE